MSDELKCKTHEEFFERYGDYVVHLQFYENDTAITVEELFQHFRTRIMVEAREIQYGG